MTYRTGELDQRVVFQERISVPDGIGGSTDTWANITTLPNAWAHIRPKSARETTDFVRVNVGSAYLMVIRYRDDIKPAYRVFWQGVAFNIIPKLPKSRSIFMEFDLTSGVAQ